MTVLVTDFGTSAVKSFLYDRATGQIIASEETETPVFSPEPGAYETDAENWLSGFFETAGALIAAHPDREISAIAITNQQISCVVLDEDYRPVHRALLWSDSRPGSVLADYRERIADAHGIDDVERWFSERVGIPFSDRWGVAKALWIRAHRPEAYAKARFISSVDAYIAQALTGRFVSDISNATFFHLDISTGRFNSEVLEKFGIGSEWFPETVPSGSVVGALQPSIQARLGLAAAVPVIISGSDQPCSMVGAGASQAGDVVINLGSGSFVMTSMSSSTTDARIMTNFSVLPDMWVGMGTHYLTGTAFRWLRDVLGWKQKLSYEELDAAASSAPPGADGLIFLPSLTGSGTPDWRSGAKGAFAGLSIEHTPGHLARAVMESTGYGVKLILETFEALGIPVTRVFLSGGATVSPCWSQTITDVLGREVRMPDSRQATARGAFLMALVGLGEFDTLEAAVASYASGGETLVPSAQNAQTYSSGYTDYLYWKDAMNTWSDARERSISDV